MFPKDPILLDCGVDVFPYEITVLVESDFFVIRVKPTMVFRRNLFFLALDFRKCFKVLLFLIDDFNKLRSGSVRNRVVLDVYLQENGKNSIHFQLIIVTINARCIKFGPNNKDKQGILMQQSTLKKLHPFENYENQHRSPFLAHPTMKDHHMNYCHHSYYFRAFAARLKLNSQRATAAAFQHTLVAHSSRRSTLAMPAVHFRCRDNEVTMAARSLLRSPLNDQRER
uniref:Uncharacterized protein n=1 Tax=Romanomermis culicivorax TaxID=13658 RepID=A0A915HWV8_ROMCU